ncbi:titin-like isoform X2 [Notolabrus celidotus]|uniref:titin-like isoform X2 n=1 Tax=Notolabrus celidotus TaxID=1203425 RepID=UPI001490013E|nr:titin-like isoform X2 [Notolabrus celidotus]
METMKPEVKKKPKPPRPLPRPTEWKRNDLDKLEKPSPLVPERPSDSELGHTQYRLRKTAWTNNEPNGNLKQRETKENPSETPVVPPRPTEKELNATTKYSHRRREQSKDTQSSKEKDQSEDLRDDTDFKQKNPSALSGMFKRSQKEKPPTFTTYVSHNLDDDEKPEEAPVKESSASKQGGLKEIMKGLTFKSSPKTSREPSPESRTEEAAPEKDKQEKNAEPKPDIGALFTGMFRKTPKDRSVSPALTVTKADSDAEETEEAEEKSSEQSSERGGLFAGIRKKPAKTTDDKENLSVHSELSASTDSLSENKEKGGIFSGMFKKSPKPSEASQTDEDQQSLHDDLSGSNDNLSENSKDKGGFFSGILRRSPKIPAEETPEQDKQTELSDSNEALSENTTTKEKGNVFSGMFKKSPKPSEGPRLEEGAERLNSELSASTDSLLENKEKGGLFSGLLKKTPKTTGEENLSSQKDLSASNDSLSEPAKEKGIGFSGLFKKPPKPADTSSEEEKGIGFSGLFKKPPKPADTSSEEEKQLKDNELSGSNEALSENSNKEKGGRFGGIFKKPPKPAEATQSDEDESPDKELSASSENLSENKQERGGGLFSGLLKKTPKATGERAESPEREAQKELSASNDDLSEGNTKEKNIFSNMFKKPQKPAEGAAADKDLEGKQEKTLSASSENLSDATVPKEKKGGLGGIFKRSASIDNLFDEEKGGLFSGLRKKTPKASGDDAAADDKDEQKELTGSTDNLFENDNTKEKGGLFSGLRKKTPKASGDDAAADDKDEQKELTGSTDNLFENDNTKEKSFFSGMFKKTPKSTDGNTTEEELDQEDTKLSTSGENLLEASTTKEKTGGLGGLFKRSPKPSPRSIPAKNPLSRSGSCDSLPGAEGDLGEVSASTENLIDATGTTKEKKGGFSGMFRRNKTIEQDSEDIEAPVGGGLRRRRTIKKKQRVVSFRVKKTLPKIQKRNAQNSEKMPEIEEAVEMQDLNPAQDSSVEVEPVEMAAYPTEAVDLRAQEENDELLEWWNTVKSWSEWNEASNFQEEDEETAMEQAADRVYMAARLFVRLFNQRGAALQHRILELLALADASDQFHKKTVSVAVGGGVASVAGSIATITGLILAPFTFGASIIVTAVGIGVATAGSITSATANITDTVHSNMDRKKLEKMIQGYQEEIKDIREIMEFVQAGMDTLDEWDFEKYSQSAAKKAMNHNLKHVVKEGGRAGKALMINTDKLISTVQVLGAAGGAAKAVSAISVTTGVMSALFLALDVFFLAKDSHELRKGAKTKFARKIRDVCKELQDGLLELNKVKTQLQKTMDGIEVEEYEEIKEVEVEVEDDFESDPKKLAELEQELDLIEEKLDKRVEEEQKRLKEIELEKEREKEREREKEMENLKKKMEKSMKEKEAEVKENVVEFELEDISDEKKEEKEEEVKEEGTKAEPLKGKKKDKETENWITAAKEKFDFKRDKPKDDKEKEKNKTGKEKKEIKSKSGDSKEEDPVEKVYSERFKTERESQRSSKEEEKEIKPEWKSVIKDREAEGGSTATRWHSSRSDKEGPHWRERGSKHEGKDADSSSVSGHGRRSSRTESWRRTEEERGVKDWRAEAKSREEKKESKDGRESRREEHGKGDMKRESYRSHETTSSRREHSQREWGSDSKRSHHRRGSDDRRERDDEKRGSRIESERSKFERAEGEAGAKDQERVRRGSDRERRGSDRDREHRHSHRSSRSQANAMLEDGLNI